MVLLPPIPPQQLWGATTPFLNISSTLYQVLDINTSNQYLRVSRLDLLNDTCPSFPRNTTLLNTPFNFLNDQNVNATIYHGCTIYQNVRNQFNCSGNNGTEFYVVGEVPLDPGLEDSSVGLRDGSMSGFEDRWEGNGAECGSCVRSGGVCGFEQDMSSFACFFADRPYDFFCGANDLASRSSGGFFNLQGITIIVSILGFTYVVVPAKILFSRFSKKRGWNKSDKEINKIVENFIINHGSLAPKRYTYTRREVEMPKLFNRLLFRTQLHRV